MSVKISTIIAFFLIFLCQQNLLAQTSKELPQVVVTANRITETLEKTTSKITVITKEDLEKMGVERVVDVLKKLPEVYVKQNGGIGKLASVFLSTSTKAGDVLVMIDGIKVNSPTTGDFDFSTLSIDEVEKIEILQGPQSTLYGSEAVSGVINIITKKGVGKPKIDFSIYGGSYETYKPAFNFSGGNDKIDYRITTYYLKTDGISAYRYGKERDGYKQSFISGKFSLRPLPNLEFEFLGRYFYDQNEIDKVELDDPNYTQRRHHSTISGKIKLNLLNNWEQTFTISKVKEIINTKDPDDLYGFFSSKVIPTLYIIDWQNNFYLLNNFTLIGGMEYRKEKGKYESFVFYDKSIENKALYLNGIISLLNNKVILNGGMRYDNHQTFGDKVTYRIGFAYNLKPFSTKIKANLGTAFKAPTLNDLFFPDTGWAKGNPHLKPENSWGWILGIEKRFFNDKTTFSLNTFYQKYKDLIQWRKVSPWIWQPQNVSKASIKGFEFTFNFSLTNNFKINAGYTNLDSEDKTTKKYLIYKPIHKISVTGEYRVGRFSVLADYIYVGERYDCDYTKLDSYYLVNLSADYKISPHFSLFGRIDNLFNKNYEEVKDYGTYDRCFYLGLKLNY